MHSYLHITVKREYLKLLKPLEMLYPKQSRIHLGKKEVYFRVHFPDQVVWPHSKRIITDCKIYEVRNKISWPERLLPSSAYLNNFTWLSSIFKVLKY